MVDFGSGNTWNGHRYWMAMTPYPLRDDELENPSILVSSNGTTWTVPIGLTNPIDAMPVGGHNADTELVYDSANDKLWCFYVDVVGTTARVLVRGSTDGVTWGSEVALFTSATGSTLPASPTVILDGATWKMWTVDVTASPNTLQYRTASAADGTWSAATTCTFDAISSRDLWHVYILKDGSTYRGLFNFCDLNVSGDDNNTLHLASSSDGLDWTVDADPVLSPSIGNFDDSNIYRACGVIDGTDLDVWYSSISETNIARIARTSWPMSLFPTT